MSRNIEIKRAKEADAEAVFEIIQNAFIRYKIYSGIKGTVDALEESIYDIKKQIAAQFVYICYVNDLPAATIRVSIDSTTQSAHISRFGVISTFNKYGIGKMLIRYIENILKDKGIKKATLITAAENSKLLANYNAWGYQIIDEIKNGEYPRFLLSKSLL